MRMGTRQAILVAAILAVAGAAAAAQTPVNIARDNFENGVGGWTLSAPAANNVGWAVDSPGAGGAGNSLNYNNGTDYNSGGIDNSGTARSPNYTIASPNYVNFTITFQCRRDTEYSNVLRPRQQQQQPAPANGADVCILRVRDSTGIIRQYQFYSVVGSEPIIPGYTAIPCEHSSGFGSHTISLNAVPQGFIALEFVFYTGDALFNNFAGWFIDNLSVDAFDPGSGGGGGGGGTYEGPGFYDPNGVYVGFPDGGPGLPPPAAPPATGTGIEPGSYDSSGVYVGTGPATGAPPTGPTDTGTAVEPGYYNADGVYIGIGSASSRPTGPTDTGVPVEPGYPTPVTTGGTSSYVGAPGSSSTRTGEGAEGSENCGLLGLEFLLPLAVLRFARRRG